MSSPEKFFADIAKLRILVIGDVMIDSYLWGKVERISPEAPVPVVQIENQDKRMGGAANVALNLKSLGVTPILCSVTGNDADGASFCELLATAGLSTDGIVASNNRITTVKQRIMAGGHHLLRVDSEQDHSLSKEENALLSEKIIKLLPTCQAVIFEDYDKGVLGKELIQSVTVLCQSLKIPVVVDPKKRNFLHYKGVSLFKPNKKEIREGLKLDSSLNKLTEVREASHILREKLHPEMVLITLSDQGVFIDSGNEDFHVPAFKREICDVSGAGDTVISVAAVAYTLGLEPELIAALSNLAGGIVCEHVGVVPISRDLFLKEIKRTNLFDSYARAKS